MPLPSLPAQADQLLDLARRDSRAAEQAFAALTPEQQAELVCRSPLGRRSELLDLAESLDALVPLLPEAELCFTVKALGLADAGALLAHATPEQLVAALDLDAWRGESLDTASLGAWLAALGAAGPTTVLRAARALDAEILVLELRRRLEVWLKPSGDEDWQPPEASQTLDGQFYWRPRHEGDDLAGIVGLLHTLFPDDYWLYFRLLQGAIWELDGETAFWAERWREGRLEELGFPPRSEAVLALYSHLPPEELAALPHDTRALDVDAWRLPVWQPELPVAADSRLALFRAAAELGEDERAAFLWALLALANAVAVADLMPLGDAESTPRAIERAAELANAGLEHLVEAHGLPAAGLLRSTPLVRLFRIGGNLRGEKPPAEAPEAGSGVA